MDIDARQQMVLRITAVIIVCTLLLTASFFGVIAALDSGVSDLAAHMPFYLLAAAVVFVSTIVLLEFYETDGKTIIMSALFTGITSFVLVLFSVEGLIFAFRNPEQALNSQLILYFLTAGLVATGLGYWALRHWREFADDHTKSL